MVNKMYADDPYLSFCNLNLPNEIRDKIKEDVLFKLGEKLDGFKSVMKLNVLEIAGVDYFVVELVFYDLKFNFNKMVIGSFKCDMLDYHSVKEEILNRLEDLNYDLESVISIEFMKDDHHSKELVKLLNEIPHYTPAIHRVIYIIQKEFGKKFGDQGKAFSKAYNAFCGLFNSSAKFRESITDLDNIRLTPLKVRNKFVTIFNAIKVVVNHQNSIQSTLNKFGIKNEILKQDTLEHILNLKSQFTDSYLLIKSYESEYSNKSLFLNNLTNLIDSNSMKDANDQLREALFDASEHFRWINFLDCRVKLNELVDLKELEREFNQINEIEQKKQSEDVSSKSFDPLFKSSNVENEFNRYAKENIYTKEDRIEKIMRDNSEKRFSLISKIFREKFISQNFFEDISVNIKKLEDDNDLDLYFILMNDKE